MPEPASFDAALTDLAQLGINHVAWVPGELGPAPSAGVSQEEGAGLLLMLSLGAAFGEQTDFRSDLEADPFDRRSLELAQGFAEAQLRSGAPETQLVYPSDRPLDLRSWLENGRVQFRSPLGTGIRPDCGPWLAVRAALWTRLSPDQIRTLQQRYPPLRESESPCTRCVTRPCIEACPARALPQREFAGLPAGGGLEACVEHRLAPASSCAHRCLARLACPVGAADRYGPDQLRYHYGVSLGTLQRWHAARRASSSS